MVKNPGALRKIGAASEWIWATGEERATAQREDHSSRALKK